MAKTAKNPADYILPLYINGLSGRMLRMPRPKNKKREIMIIYGHHASLERIFGIAEYMNKYGGVTIPDLPGFGGMDSFYKISEKPTLDNMADYLATFIKLRYKKQKFDLAGLSLGFMVITKMLQKYPEIAKQINLLISFAGFTNKSDFKYTKLRRFNFRWATSLLSMRLPAAFIRNVLFRPSMIRLAYNYLEPRLVKEDATKIRNADLDERRRRIDFEIILWQSNDVRTYMDMANTMLTLDLKGAYVDKDVYHLAIDEDRYFNNVKVEEHMREIYKNFNLVKGEIPAHSPSVIATAEEAAPYVPESIRKLLRKKPGI